MSDTGSSTILPAVEQRIGSKSQPLDAAAVNPAYIPGLTSPAKAEPKDAAVEEAASEEAASEEAVVVEDAAPETAVAEEASAEPEEEATSESDSDSAARTGPGRSGVRGVRPARLDQGRPQRRTAASGRPGGGVPLGRDRRRRDGVAPLRKRFTITVHTPDRRWYPIQIEATARTRFKEWEDQRRGPGRLLRRR